MFKVFKASDEVRDIIGENDIIRTNKIFVTYIEDLSTNNGIADFVAVLRDRSSNMFTIMCNSKLNIAVVNKNHKVTSNGNLEWIGDLFSNLDDKEYEEMFRHFRSIISLDGDIKTLKGFLIEYNMQHLSDKIECDMNEMLTNKHYLVLEC